MRLIFGIMLVLAGIAGTMLVGRLLPRVPREMGAESGPKGLRLVAAVLVPIGVLMTLSSTATLIQQRYLERWDGKLPQFSAGGSTPGILFNFPAPPASTGRP
jgi:hypothetical protein